MFTSSLKIKCSGRRKKLVQVSKARRAGGYDPNKKPYGAHQMTGWLWFVRMCGLTTSGKSAETVFSNAKLISRLEALTVWGPNPVPGRQGCIWCCRRSSATRSST